MLKGLVLLAAAICFLQSATASRPVTVESLGWLQGCWEGGDGSSQISEQWMSPAGGCMLAMSRTVKGGETVAYEFIRVWRNDAGDIYFTARPSGQAEASFKLVRVADREVVFENSEHDFPQRIIYRLAADGRLVARIEGAKGGKARAVDFPMRRASCGGD